MSDLLDAAIIIQARMGSGRLPGKTMLPLAGHRMLHHVVARLERAPIAGPLIVATSDQPTDDFICSFTGSTRTLCFRGSEEDVLSRFWGAAHDLDVKYIIRATADNPLVWEGAVAHLGHWIDEIGCDYITYNPDMPTGLGVELFTKKALRKAHKETTDPKHREHVTPYIYMNEEMFDVVRISPPKEIQGQFRLTVDTLDDYELMKQVYERLYHPGDIIPAAEAVDLLRRDRRLAGINAEVHQRSFEE